MELSTTKYKSVPMLVGLDNNPQWPSDPDPTRGILWDLSAWYFNKGGGRGRGVTVVENVTDIILIKT